MPDRTDRAPQRRSRKLRVPVPVVFRVRIGPEGAEPPRDRDEPFHASGLADVHARVAHVEQRLPVLRSARLCRELRMVAQPRLYRLGVAEHQCRLQRGRGDVRIEREQPVRAAGRAAGRAAQELVDRCLERQRSCFDFLAQRRPGREPVLAGDHRLRVVERQIECADLFDRFARQRGQGGEAAERVRLAGLRRMEQGLGLLLQLLEIRAVRQLARHRTTSMLGLWFASRQHGGVGAVGPEEV